MLPLRQNHVQRQASRVATTPVYRTLQDFYRVNTGKYQRTANKSAAGKTGTGKPMASTGLWSRHYKMRGKT